MSHKPERGYTSFSVPQLASSVQNVERRGGIISVLIKPRKDRRRSCKHSGRRSIVRRPPTQPEGRDTAWWSGVPRRIDYVRRRHDASRRLSTLGRHTLDRGMRGVWGG